MEFAGVEKLGFELMGSMTPTAARDKTGGNVPVDDVNGRVAVSMQLLSIVNLKPGPIPLKFTYSEVLWRIAVVLKKKPAWLLVKADVDQPLARLMCSFLMGYPARNANIEVTERGRTVGIEIKAGDASLDLSLELNTNAPPTAEKRLLAVRDGARFFKVPWGTAQANSRQGAYVRLTDNGLSSETLQDGIVWEEQGVLWRQREHTCGSPEDMALI